MLQIGTLSNRLPLLFWALFFLLGTGAALHPHLIYLLPFALLLFLTKRRTQGILFLLLGYCWTLFFIPKIDDGPHKGQGIFVLTSLQPTQSPFERSLMLKGYFKAFQTEEQTYTHLPCILFQKEPPKKGKEWLLEGTYQGGRFKPKKKSPWRVTKEGFSLARWRYQNKEKVRAYFHKRCKEKKAAHFFTSIATGIPDDRLLSMEFRKVGLGHILAISGFHFALFAALLGGGLRLLLPPNGAYLLLLALLTAYFLFLGISASILRAYLMIGLYIVGLLSRRQIEPCNLLGAALLIELVYNPLMVKEIGFILSFLATFGILCFYPYAERKLIPLLPKRTLEQAKALSFIEKHAYLLTTAIRKGLALNIAVTLATLPVTLFLFRNFAFLGLVYNAVIAPFVGISLLLLPLGCLFPPLAYLNERFTHMLLEIISHPPETLNFKLFITHFPYGLLIALVSLLVILGLTLRGNLRENGNPLWRS
jgi:competence protein ComEC